ncbi:HHIP-like protein 1 isoform X3 [Oopsacas minuta]|uniref:HHIP-like protein 1 isoform X3 n=1 Tax=Oopsacas minuta TaxID=111878 RepID=A0AAV7JLQ4_9METZ|nr:HHIP-like protein 1 isoform X3 [Oopsacas minuta]
MRKRTPAATIIPILQAGSISEGLLGCGKNIARKFAIIFIKFIHTVDIHMFDLGSGSRTLVSTQSIELGKPISIRAIRNEKSGQLFIDDNLEASGDSPGISNFFAVNTDIYLGGVPFGHLIAPFGSTQGFEGCIGSFQLDIMQTFYIFLVLLLDILTVNCHPQCLDYLPPFSPDHPTFCANDYPTLSCCTQRQEYELAFRFWTKIWKLNRIERGVCSEYIRKALCTECSPYSAHIYDAEGVSAAQQSPGLCPLFCTALYRYNCSDVILELFGIQKREYTSAEDFCSDFAISDSDYCYPGVLEISTDVTSGIKTPVDDGDPDRDNCLCVREIISSLRNPIALVAAYDGTHRMFVAEQLGIVHVILPDGTKLAEPFLDISSRVLVSSYKGDERGFLGIAFHPLFKKNRRVYVYYSVSNTDNQVDEYGRRASHVSRLSQFTLSTTDPNRLDESSEEIILELPEPRSNHNGGSLFFDLDNYLYLSLGDGGGRGDDFGSIGNGQNTTNIHGTMVRIDVDDISTRREGFMYGIPPSNPFINSDFSEVRHEIFAYGFRNIWRCSLDRGDSETNAGQGRILCGDVGQGRYEEVDLVKKGKNYGWRVMEGNTCYQDCNSENDDFEPPIIVYAHSEGKSVIGGKVYRGCLFPRLKGKYIFGDYTSGTLFYGIENESTGHWSKEDICLAADSSCLGGGNSNSYKTGILSFGESESGEIYFLSTSNPSSTAKSGSIYQLVDPTSREECDFSVKQPKLISSPSNWEHSNLCRGCGSTTLTSTNICNIIDDFVIIVSFISRGKDPFTSEVYWLVEVNDIMLLLDRSLHTNGDVIELWESNTSVLCRCISSKVNDIVTERPKLDTQYIVSGRVKGNALYVYRGTLVLEMNDDRQNVLDEYFNSCFT